MSDKEAIQKAIDNLNLEYTAEFIPTKQPAASVKHPQLHWKIALKRGGRHMSVDYHEGCAHVVGYQQFHKTPCEKRRHDEIIRTACETGVYPKYTRDWVRETFYYPKVKQPAPQLIDVLYCLVQDSEVIDRGSFEEWASDYGYDLDSRSAEKTYRLCLEQSLQLRNLIGNDNLEQLKELYQDY